MSNQNDLIHPLFENILAPYVTYELPSRCVNCGRSLDDKPSVEVDESVYCSLSCVSELLQTQAEMWADDEDRYRDR